MRARVALLSLSLLVLAACGGDPAPDPGDNPLTGAVDDATRAAQVPAAARAGTGDPAAILRGGPWTITDVAGTPVPAGATATIEFGEGAVVVGHTGCNQFTGRFELDAEGLRFPPLAVTRIGCPAPLADFEQALLAHLAAVVRYDVDEGGALLLSSIDGRALRAVRQPADERQGPASD